jgi:hypothetical protein
MQRVYGAIYNWAKKTSTSFAELRFLASEREEVAAPGGGLVYRLKYWPDLPPQRRTAVVFRTLSVMSHRPVNRHWMLAHSKLDNQEIDALLKYLVDEDAVEVIDCSKYPAAPK